MGKFLSVFCGHLGHLPQSMNLVILDKGEIFTKADLSEVPKTKASKLKKRELAKARSKVGGSITTEHQFLNGLCKQPSAKRVKDNAKSLSLRSKQQVRSYHRFAMA